MDISQNIASILEQMAKFFQSDTVVGDPIQVGDVTLIPLITVSFGIGNGSGFSPKEKGNKWGPSGAASGGKISPTAIVVIKKDEVSVIPLSGKGPLDKINEILPTILSRMDKNEPDNDSSS